VSFLFNHERTGWLKFVSSRERDVLEELYKATSDPSHKDIALALGLSEMDTLNALSELDRRGLIEYYLDSSMGPAVFRWKPKYTVKQLRKWVFKKLLVSVFSDWSDDAVEGLIEELQSRPAVVQAIKDAFP